MASSVTSAADILQRIRQRNLPPPMRVKLWLHPIGYTPPAPESAAPMLWGMGILAVMALAAVVNW